MTARPSVLTRTLKQTGWIVLALCLCGCFTDELLGRQTHYRLDGLKDDAPLTTYLQTIMDEGAREEADYEAANQEEEERRETYYEQRIKTDLLKGLRAKGYYEGTVRYSDDDAPLTGSYTVQPGPIYRIASVKISPDFYESLYDPAALQEGAPLDAATVLKVQADLYKTIQKDRCYFSMDVRNAVALDKPRNTAAITFAVEAGPEATFGPISFEGLETVQAAYLSKLVPWKEGDCFRREKIEKLRTTLLESGLFVQAESLLPESPEPDGAVPVTLQLKERAHRTLSAGVSYYTDEGPGTNFGWEHRNMFGAAEHFKAALAVSTLKQSLTANLTKPRFLRNDQSLSLSSGITREDADAYEEFGIEAGASLNRTFNKRLSGSTGISLNITEIKEDGGDGETFGLISLPTSLSFDNRDSALDPHKGWLLSGKVTPFFDAFGQSDPFFKLQSNASTYLALGTEYDLVLASRLGMGSILGSSTDDLPATERFYAGGGGSVRGYGYQQVGPFEDGDPVGGRSSVTGSVEMRAKFTQSFGGVAFVDGGSVSDKTVPDLNNLAIGAGVGIRYYTGFGPVRFDIAVPLTEKQNLDRNYQFYISIGQAF